MNIVHLSDIHFRQSYEQSENGYQEMLALMQSPLIPLAKCLKNIQAQQAIDLLIISGDLTDSGEAEDYRVLKRFIQEQIGDVKIIVTMGNHDIKSNFRIGWLDEVPSEEPYNVVEHFDDFTILSFDSAVHGNSNGYLSEEQLKWLDHALEEAKNKPIILVTHHHLFENQSPITALPEANRLLEKLSSRNVLCVLNGHTHHSYETKIDQTTYFTVVGMSFVGEDLGAAQVRFEEKYGYHVYQIENGKIVDTQSKVYETGNILKTLNMSQ
ncbi:metallophosphoesterase family protein [Marinilactibacillus kalidii]|uniref:metallophosphoesterase family protein n=1 Tax=Marinilactibacillus kalidii TaxID=2820274 RepID=UPI001ABDE384|nr:metallophosphoesterase [Marinilactibacillus kalidii]